ncbi:metal-sensitive transcriptional regulator [uncultured Imperialibacter sp.]|uniref:metal-sensitive transcriptional regulator n=1 Tax=Imperialibacter sp. TaxID=2038411 RepID=UPI0030D9D6A0|tara:strand:+ start:3129 stop:3509 length:381 start_codon:yes stop_codon:yes gene_type:complete
MLPKDLTKDVKNRLQSIKGQIEGLIKMLDEGKDPEKILVQFKAAKSGLDAAHYLLLNETFRKSLAIKISETSEACPGNCGNEEKIEILRQQFPAIEADDLTVKMKEIVQLKKHLDQFIQPDKIQFF